MTSKVNNMIKAALFLAIAIVFQVIGKNIPAISQSFVGPAVNAVLILTAFICGTSWGISVGVLTPLLAWLTGQLPAPFGPFVPFIMIGNALYVFLFGIMKNEGRVKKYIGLGAGALIKYLFLYLSASKFILVLHLSIPPKIASNLIRVMGIPQLVTAIIGGIVALILIEILTKRNQLI